MPGRPAIQAEWLTANRVKSRGHDKRLVGELQDAAIQMVRDAGLPLIQRARIIAEYQPPANRHYDPSNLAPSAKAYVDGLVKAGALSDDASEYLIGPDMRAATRTSRGPDWRGWCCASPNCRRQLALRACRRRLPLRW